MAGQAQFIKCDICDLYYDKDEHANSQGYHGICKECGDHDKMRNPMRILNRIKRRRTYRILSSFELFELYQSGLLETMSNGDHLLKHLRRKLHRKFNKV